LGQERNPVKIPPSDAIQNYLTKTKAYSTLYNGKIEKSYDVLYANHPYLGADKHVQGTLCYNEVVYHDILMRLDLNRDELTVFSPDKRYHIVLEIEKFNYAIFNGYTIITSMDESNVDSKYRILLKDGVYPVVKQYKGRVEAEQVSAIAIKQYFRFKEQFFVYINGIAYQVKNKNALLKLFPDKKKELNEFAKKQKLSFWEQNIEHAIIALVNHYESLISGTQMTQKTQIK